MYTSTEGILLSTAHPQTTAAATVAALVAYPICILSPFLATVVQSSKYIHHWTQVQDVQDTKLDWVFDTINIPGQDPMRLLVSLQLGFTVIGHKAL